MSDNDYDIVIAGGGIAGLTAALVSARAGRRTRVLTGPALGGQLLSIERIDGYPGFPDGIPGYELCPMIQEQAVAAGAEFSAATATGLAAREGRWNVTSSEGEVRAGAVVIATGTSSKELGIPGEARLRGKGVSHCASCDGPLLRSRTGRRGRGRRFRAAGGAHAGPVRLPRDRAASRHDAVRRRQPIANPFAITTRSRCERIPSSRKC